MLAQRGRAPAILLGVAGHSLSDDTFISHTRVSRLQHGLEGYPVKRQQTEERYDAYPRHKAEMLGLRPRTAGNVEPPEPLDYEIRTKKTAPKSPCIRSEKPGQDAKLRQLLAEGPGERIVKEKRSRDYGPRACKQEDHSS